MAIRRRVSTIRSAVPAAGAASVAALAKALQAGWIHPEEKIVSVVTGHGLKDIRGAISAVRQKAVQIGRKPSQLADQRRLAGIVEITRLLCNL